MPNLNKVFLMGHLTRDPEMRYSSGGSAIASFGIAVNRKWKGKDGEVHKETDFVEVAAFGRMAETICQYLTKGKPIFIEGRLKFSQWESKAGYKQSKLSVNVDSFQFLGGASSETRGGAGGQPSTPPSTDDISDDKMPF